MNIREINQALFEGKTDVPGVLPHRDELKKLNYIFEVNFGLPELPLKPGIIVVRGARQYGKSTWLESQIEQTIVLFGPGSAFYLNGDEIKDTKDLTQAIESTLLLFHQGVKVRRLFIDEITAIDDWEYVLKRIYDRGLLRDVLIVATGSKAFDLRHGTERLPGRKGKLDRNNYYFTPISFQEFTKVCGKVFKSKTLIAYILTGGCPIACNELAVEGRIPEYVVTMIKDWIYGECVGAGRSRSSLLAVLELLMKFALTPIGYSKLARETGLANNTVAAGYIELLGDLLTVASCYYWDASRRIELRRKPCKFHFINLLAAVVWVPSKIRSIADFELMPNPEQAKFYEWLVAQELWRRAAIRGDEYPERLNFWQSDNYEIDFVVTKDLMIEVKLGRASPLDFHWFPKIFPKAHLKVITTNPFKTDKIEGVLLEDFLREQ